MPPNILQNIQHSSTTIRRLGISIIWGIRALIINGKRNPSQLTITYFRINYKFNNKYQNHNILNFDIIYEQFHITPVCNNNKFKLSKVQNRKIQNRYVEYCVLSIIWDW